MYTQQIISHFFLYWSYTKISRANKIRSPTLNTKLSLLYCYIYLSGVKDRCTEEAGGCYGLHKVNHHQCTEE